MNNTNNPLREKSYKFAVEVGKMALRLKREKKEFVLSKQVLRSGTSVGANVEEAQGCQSRRDFLARISIAYREALETKYWLNLLKDLGLISKEEFESLVKQNEEALKMLAKSRITTRKKLR